MPEEFKVKPHNSLPDKQMIEYWKDGEFIAGIYPHQDGIRIVSEHMTGVEGELGFPHAVVIRLEIVKKCMICGEGKIVDKEERDYETTVAGMKMVLDVAIVGTCDKCGMVNYAFRKDAMQ